jgi:hypothetical protein
MPKHRLGYLLLTAVAALLVMSCGYSLRKSTPVSAVRLGAVENKTYEPRLQDFLFEALSVEFQKQGIRVDHGAAHSVTGTIDEFTVTPTAEKDDVTIQWELAIEGSFFLTSPEGEKKPLRKSNIFIVTFEGEGPLEEVIASREGAIRQALRDLARELVTSVIYGR